MDTFVDERDYLLLDRDPYTFFVLRRVMGGSCELLLTDHEKMILCFTGDPYPVWIWTPDHASPAELESVYGLARENGLLDGKHRLNVKYNLAEYFMKRSQQDGRPMTVYTRMFAYDCKSPIPPAAGADGTLYRCGAGDIEELTELLDLFHREVGIDQKSIAGYRSDAAAFIESGHMYFWKDDQGHNVASCKFDPDGEMASVNLVFTRPAYRRKHYAENLVYRVSLLVRDAGYVPMLYTDADYEASNACYEKVGYVLRGKLCMIG